MNSKHIYYFQKQRIKELEEELEELRQILNNILVDGLFEELGKETTTAEVHTDAFKKANEYLRKKIK